MITFLWILLIIASLVGQTTFLSPARLQGVRIDLLLILTIFVGLYRGQIKGGLTGFMGGLLEDSLSGSLMGMGALSKTVAGFLSGFWGIRLYRQSFLARLVIVFLVILIHELIYLCLMLFICGFPSPPSLAMVRGIALTVIINTLLSPLFFLGLKKILGKKLRRFG